MVPFILSDNPSMPGSRARQISRMMTNGEKGAIFVLYLSFLGWYLLAGLAVGMLTELFWPTQRPRFRCHNSFRDGVSGCNVRRTLHLPARPRHPERNG